MGGALSHHTADGRKTKTVEMAFLSLGLFSLTCQFKLSFPLSLASKLQGGWGWSFSLGPPFEAELPCQEESKAWREESKAWRKKRHEESGSVTSWSPDSATFPVLLFVPGTFPVFHIKKSKEAENAWSQTLLRCSSPWRCEPRFLSAC